MSDLESTFQQAQPGSIPNSQEIFGVLQGTEFDYDEKLFDAVTEVRLAAWARSNGYQEIEKLRAIGGRPTPDFLMKRPGKIVLAEARHFQVRDYLVYFVADLLEGLAVRTGRLANFGLRVEIGDKYMESRKKLLKNRSRWADKARNELTEEWFATAVQSLEANSDLRVEVLNGLISIERSTTSCPGRVLPALMSMLSPQETVKWCLWKLRNGVLDKLKQIKGFMGPTGTSATHAILFFSGVDEWEPEWEQLWETLDAGDQWVWDCVATIKADADKMISLPFELIVGNYKKMGTWHYGPIVYRPFSWHP